MGCAVSTAVDQARLAGYCEAFFSIKLLKTISKRPVRIRIALLFLWKSIIRLDILLLGKIYFTDFRKIKYQIPHFYFGHIEISWF